jgi:RimJ/RimL family protein N-acetyltransferase
MLIRLRPYRADEVDTAWQGLALQDEAAHPRRRPADRRLQPSEQFRRRLHHSGRLWRGCLNLAIDRDGRLAGTIQARTSPAQTLPAGVYEIGVILYQPRDRGNGYGAEAVELLTAWLFETGKAERVQAGTDAGNTPMRAVLERLGFQLEGVMRGYGAMSDGTRIDGAMYAVLKPEWMTRARQPATGRLVRMWGERGIGEVTPPLPAMRGRVGHRARQLRERPPGPGWAGACSPPAD